MDASSLWLSGPRASVDEGDPPRGADVVIVGGGLLGVLCTYWLARMGVTVVLLEQRAIASGATGRNSGLVIPTTAEPYDQAVNRLGAPVATAMRQLAISGAALLEQIINEEQIICGYRRDGFVQIAANDTDAAQLQAEITVAEQHGFPAAWLDHDALQSRIRTRLRDTIPGAMLLPGAMLNSVALVDGILTAARRRGARVFTGVGVTAVRAEDHHVVVETTNATLHANTAVTAVNAWLADLAPALRHVVRPVQGQLIATSPLPHMFPHGMAVQLTAHGEYWQQTPDGTILLGGCRSVTTPPTEPLAQRPQPAVHEALRQVLPTLFPDLRDIQIQTGWAGAMAFTPDWIPITDQIAPSIWAIGGFCGHGMPFGASISKILTAHITNGGSLAEVNHLRLDRPSLLTEPHPASSHD